MAPVFLFLVVMVQFKVGYTYVVNKYDGHLRFECPHPYQHVSRITSWHDNHREDRIFSMSCSNVASGVEKLKPSCYWTEYVNDFDDLLAYKCSHNQYISGLTSDHSNKQEDRRWKIKCCKMGGIKLTGCKYTDWTNTWDNYQSFDSKSYVTIGIISVHNNHHEDRRYKFEVCRAQRNE